ncbi:hypothetical protein B4Q13_22135, partial [Lacticaseibacillus rhamnosus]
MEVRVLLEPLVVELDVRNTGALAGDDIVLLFSRDMCASVTRPVRQLQAFQRVSLQPGEAKSLRFVLAPEHFEFSDSVADGARIR